MRLGTCTCQLRRALGGGVRGTVALDRSARLRAGTFLGVGARRVGSCSRPWEVQKKSFSSVGFSFFLLSHIEKVIRL